MIYQIDINYWYRIKQTETNINIHGRGQLIVNNLFIMRLQDVNTDTEYYPFLKVTPKKCLEGRSLGLKVQYYNYISRSKSKQKQFIK